MGVLMLLVLGILLALSVPIAFSLMAAALLAIIMMGNSITMIPQMLVSGVQSYILMAVPLFMLAGALMNESGTTDRIFRFARALVGHLRGGLAHVNVLASLVFAGMSGSAVADSSGLGMIEIKAMKDHGYSAEFAAAITAASSTIGPIVPPSIPMVVFGGLANVSIGALFLAGAVPGVMMALLLMVAVTIVATRRNYPRDNRASFKEIVGSFVGAILPLLMPLIILGGILGGIFTPTEAAAIAVVYALFLGFVVYRTLTWKKLLDVLGTVALNTAVVLVIIAATAPFRWIVAYERIPLMIYSLLTQITESPLILLLILNGVFLLLGCVMENTAVIILSVPILMPVVHQFGIDPVHFGVVMVLNLMIGLITPPVGLCLFTTSAIAKVSVGALMKELRPFFFALVISLLLVTFIPQIALWLPALVMGS